MTNLGAPWFFDEAPSWAPDRDLLLVPNDDGLATILDPATGVQTVLAGSTWPARWSAGGAFVYWLEGDSTIVATTNGVRVATWPGHPSNLWWQNRIAIVDARGLDSEVAPAALLETDEGTWIHDPALDAPLLVEDAAGGTWSPDGSMAALAARRTTSEFDQQRWEILIYVDHGSIRSVASDAQSSFLPPELWWNEAGTHILIRFPGGEWP